MLLYLQLQLTLFLQHNGVVSILQIIAVLLKRRVEVRLELGLEEVSPLPVLSSGGLGCCKTLGLVGANTLASHDGGRVGLLLWLQGSQEPSPLLLQRPELFLPLHADGCLLRA